MAQYLSRSMAIGYGTARTPFCHRNSSAPNSVASRSRRSPWSRRYTFSTMSAGPAPASSRRILKTRLLRPVPIRSADTASRPSSVRQTTPKSGSATEEMLMNRGPTRHDLDVVGGRDRRLGRQQELLDAGRKGRLEEHFLEV